MGLNIFRADNREKLASLILEARENAWGLAFLADLHGGRSNEVCFVAVEEFVIIVSEKVGFLLDWHVADKWVQQGGQLEVHDPRLCSLRVTLGG